MYDVVISGAGPSGSQCAEILAKSGYKIALIDRNIDWRKPCGGGCSVRLLKYYPQLKKLNIINKHTIMMYSSDYTKFQYTYEKRNEYSFVMDRLVLDSIMRTAAIDAGAELFDRNVSFDFITKNQKKIGIKTKTHEGINEYYGNIIVIADGMSSKLALKSEIRPIWKIEDLGLAKCSILEGNNNLNTNSVYFYFKNHYGYGWIFPINNKRFNLGVITFYKDNLNFNLNELYNQFINEPDIKKLLPESNYKKIWSAAFPEPANGVLNESLYSDNLIIVGDAAGFVSPISGEGLHASIVSGNIAAQTIIKALENEDYSKNALKEYKFHSNIKKIIQNFKLKRSFANFFYGNSGKNLNTTFQLSEKDSTFRKIVADTFLFNKLPPKDFFTKIMDFKN